MAFPINAGVALEIDEFFPHSIQGSIVYLHYDINNKIRYSQIEIPLCYKYYYYSKERHFGEIHIDLGGIYSFIFSQIESFPTAHRYGLTFQIGYEYIVSINLGCNMFVNALDVDNYQYASLFNDLQPFLNVELKLPYLFDN